MYPKWAKKHDISVLWAQSAVCDEYISFHWTKMAVSVAHEGLCFLLLKNHKSPSNTFIKSHISFSNFQYFTVWYVSMSQPKLSHLGILNDLFFSFYTFSTCNILRISVESVLSVPMGPTASWCIVLHSMVSLNTCFLHTQHANHQNSTFTLCNWKLLYLHHSIVLHFVIMVC